ncbi:MAG: HAD-IIIA family hydrolase [Candidatus Calescibacterium sp.]|nr:HAD-IIIA family hydrolase [Candidatus Calescibacterium sp.]
MVVKTIFLDRDGVINKYLNQDYVKCFGEFILESGFLEFWRLHKKYYKFIVITNQAGINKGIVSLSFFIDLSLFLIREFLIDAVYFCPHREEENCRCRKPKNLLLKKAIERFSVDIENSYFIGDSYTDLECAQSLGLSFILVLTGKSTMEDVKKWEKKPYKIVENLSELNLIK